MKKVMVTAVGAPPGLNTAKILRNDYHVIAVDADKYACGLYLDGVKPFVIPAASQKDYIDSLVEICIQEKVDVLVPCYETETIVISENRKKLEDNGVKLLLADHDIIVKCIDKYETAKQAVQAGIPCPRTQLMTDIFADENSDIVFPAVLKPAIGSGARGISYPENKDEALEFYKQLNEKAILQERIEGEAGSVHVVACLYDKSSKLKASFVSRSLKTTQKTGGPAVVGEPVINEEIKRMGIALLESFGNFVGVAAVEFKLDSKDGVPKVLEINPRLWGYSRLAYESGINFHKMVVKLAMDEEVEEVHHYSTDKILVRHYDDRVFDKEKLNGCLQ